MISRFEKYKDVDEIGIIQAREYFTRTNHGLVKSMTGPSWIPAGRLFLFVPAMRGAVFVAGSVDEVAAVDT